MKTILNIKIFKRVLLFTLSGYIIGLVISHINLFGSSQNASLMCAFGAMAFSILSLKN
ncbi:hypothetical protein [Psychroflexus tropicus]|uniref:hypothetical protein n=1 Tax=Psychroflexus tropicus TaxID=197345 RepID=UPI00037493A9|nr:hypothetical protein [Psychroflexus tropicus]